MYKACSSYIDDIKKFGSICFIDSSAVKENYKILCDKAGGKKVIPVIKANAYSLGISNIAPVLTQAGANEFFVATFSEALELHGLIADNGEKNNIYCLHGANHLQINELIELDIIIVINSIEQIILCIEYAKKYNSIPRVVLHFDTGMNRLGIKYEEHKKWLLDNHDDITRYLDIQYIMSHLAVSDKIDSDYNIMQLQKLLAVKEIYPTYKYSLAASYGIYLGKEFILDMVRPGFAIYGCDVHYNENDTKLKQVIYMYSSIIGINNCSVGETVGYGATWRAKRNTKTAVISLGYKDGFLNNIKTAGVYINGEYAKILGRVSMDQVVIDVTDISSDHVYINSIVEIVGESCSIDDRAQELGLIQCETLISIGSRYCKKLINF